MVSLGINYTHVVGEGDGEGDLTFKKEKVVVLVE